jgi:hypothetical protein
MEEDTPAAAFQGFFAPDGPAGMIGLLEQDQGGVFLPGQLFRRGEKHAVPGDLKGAAFDEFSQARFTIDIEMPMELIKDGLHGTRAAENAVELLAEAHGVLPAQILPAEAAGQFPQDTLQ